MDETKKSALKKGGDTVESELDRILVGSAENNKTADSEELEKRERELNVRELKFKAKQLLTQNGLPIDLAEILKLENEESVASAVEMLVRLGGEKKNEEGFKVLDEKKLPEIKEEEKHSGRLRKAFGLI